ncbi:MAG: hypothetical protein HYS71_01590 [Candidatus Omnitrophica bacterium]|nr:hypothetical protein [Candidatus Omnitrophota bacterium]
MSKSQIQQITVVVLLAVFAVVWTMTRRSSAPTQAPAPPWREAQAPSKPASGPAPKEEPLPSTGVARDLFRPPPELLKTIRRKEELAREEEKLAEERRRREQPVRESAINPPPLQLQGILWGSSTGPRAIVNRQILRVGQSIEEAQIIAIEKDGIRILYQEREFFIPMPVAGSTKEKS